MDAVTYPNEKVCHFITEKLISLRVPPDHKPLSVDFNVQWTPTLMVLDQDGKAHHRTVGFMDVDELIPSLLLGMGNAYFDSAKYKEALACYDKVSSQYPASDFSHEAIFQTGVSLYKSSQNPVPLREAYERLKEEYPTSQWTKRAYPYRLIK
jgi:tetratricopeptide (TPR) repeat protein